MGHLRETSGVLRRRQRVPRTQLQDGVRWIGIVFFALLGVMGLGTVAGEIAARCQCHYTPALFAEREGLRRIELGVTVPEVQRRAFVKGLETLNVFVDPTYKNGTSDTAAVFAEPGRAAAIRRAANQLINK